MSAWLPVLVTCKFSSFLTLLQSFANEAIRYALAADIQTIPGLPTAPGYLNVDVDAETGEIDGLF
jgi:formyltetrahydrofolate synthetase